MFESEENKEETDRQNFYGNIVLKVCIDKNYPLIGVFWISTKKKTREKPIELLIDKKKEGFNK